MSWAEYEALEDYTSFEEGAFAYKHAIDVLKDYKKSFLDINDKKVFILGGVKPTRQSHHSFNNLCCQIHPNPKDIKIVLDMDPSRFKFINQAEFPNRLVARLERPPIRENSVDILFLDYTINFMQERQISEMISFFERLLTNEGIVLAIIEEPLIEAKLFRPLFNRRGSRINKVGFYSHTVDEIIKLLSPNMSLSLSYNCKSLYRSTFTLLILSKKIFFHNGFGHIPRVYDQELADLRI